MKKSEVLTDRDRIFKLWTQVEKTMNTAKTPIAKAELKKIESTMGTLFQKLGMESINPNLKD